MFSRPATLRSEVARANVVVKAAGEAGLELAGSLSCKALLHRRPSESGEGEATNRLATGLERTRSDGEILRAFPSLRGSFVSRRRGLHPPQVLSSEHGFVAPEQWQRECGANDEATHCRSDELCLRFSELLSSCPPQAHECRDAPELNQRAPVYPRGVRRGSMRHDVGVASLGRVSASERLAPDCTQASAGQETSAAEELPSIRSALCSPLSPGRQDSPRASSHVPAFHGVESVLRLEHGVHGRVEEERVVGPGSYVMPRDGYDAGATPQLNAGTRGADAKEDVEAVPACCDQSVREEAVHRPHLQPADSAKVPVMAGLEALETASDTSALACDARGGAPGSGKEAGAVEVEHGSCGDWRALLASAGKMACRIPEGQRKTVSAGAPASVGRRGAPARMHSGCRGRLAGGAGAASARAADDTPPPHQPSQPPSKPSPLSHASSVRRAGPQLCRAGGQRRGGGAGTRGGGGGAGTARAANGGWGAAASVGQGETARTGVTAGGKGGWARGLVSGGLESECKGAGRGLEAAASVAGRGRTAVAASEGKREGKGEGEGEQEIKYAAYDMDGNKFCADELRKARNRAILRGMTYMHKFLRRNKHEALYKIGDDAPSIFFEIWYTSAHSAIRARARDIAVQLTNKLVRHMMANPSEKPPHEPKP